MRGGGRGWGPSGRGVEYLHAPRPLPGPPPVGVGRTLVFGAHALAGEAQAWMHSCRVLEPQDGRPTLLNCSARSALRAAPPPRTRAGV
jgi:hypothetical protein